MRIGLTSVFVDEIAEELFLGPATIRTHIGRAMGKFGARDRAQLVILAVRARDADGVAYVLDRARELTAGVGR
jgi:predicted transcriptional regulator